MLLFKNMATLVKIKTWDHENNQKNEIINM